MQIDIYYTVGKAGTQLSTFLKSVIQTAIYQKLMQKNVLGGA